MTLESAHHTGDGASEHTGGPAKRIETQMEQRLRSTIARDEPATSIMRIEGSVSSAQGKSVEESSRLNTQGPSKVGHKSGERTVGYHPEGS